MCFTDYWIINVKTALEIANSLHQYYVNKEELNQLSILAKDYFNEYSDGEKIESMVNIVKYAVDNNLNPSDFGGKDKMLAAVQTLLQSDSYNEELGNRQIQAQKQWALPKNH
mgnify:CR=1 FL=1